MQLQLQLHVSYIAYNDSKNKQKEKEELADMVGFVQTYLFLHRFRFLLFSSSVLLFYVGAIALNKSAILQITACWDLTRV